MIEGGPLATPSIGASKHMIRQREPVLFSASSWQTLVSVSVPNAADGNSLRRKADGDVDQSEGEQQEFIHNVLFAGVSETSWNTESFSCSECAKKPLQGRCPISL